MMNQTLNRNTALLSILTVIIAFTLQTDSIASDQPLKVYVLVGQSNMQGHAHVRTLEHVGMDPKTAPILHEIRGEDGVDRVHRDVWISSLSTGGEKHGQLTTGYGADENKIGPELTFGIDTQKRVQQPILIIKTAWGGKSINTDFRSPSAGPYQFSATQLETLKKRGKDVDAIKAEKEDATGHYFRLTVSHVKEVLSDIKRVYPSYDSEQGYELAGLVWFQGWNDMVDSGTYPNRNAPGGYEQYSVCLTHFIRDIRKELGAPKLPFVIGVMGVGGPVNQYGPDQKRYRVTHQSFRDAMAAPASEPEFQGNVVAVRTEEFWDMELVPLRAKENAIKQQVKKLRQEGKLNPSEIKAEESKQREEAFTERQRNLLQIGVSNAEYHYLGSSKIMAQIGKGFAEAMGTIER